MRARHRRRHGRHKLNGLADQFAQAGDGLGLLRQSQHGGQKNHLSRGVERVDSLSHLGKVLVVAQILGDVGGTQLTRRVACKVERIGGKLLQFHLHLESAQVVHKKLRGQVEVATDVGHRHLLVWQFVSLLARHQSFHREPCRLRQSDGGQTEVVGLGLPLHLQSRLGQQLCGLRGPCGLVADAVVGVCGGQLLHRLQRTGHGVTLRVIAQKADGTRVEMQGALSCSDDGHALAALCQGDAAGQSRQSASYNDCIVSHRATSLLFPATRLMPQRPS